MAGPVEDQLAERGLHRGTDGLVRCAWGVGSEEYRDYHDHEWGVPVRGDEALYERITLEAFQSGLSWITVLRKRPAFRVAFRSFDPRAVAEFSAVDIERLMGDATIIRNRLKIEAAIANAQALVHLWESDGPGALTDLVWSHALPGPRPRDRRQIPSRTPASTALCAALKSRGFRFVGPTTMYAAMQACGLVDDHLEGCYAGVGGG